MNLDEMQEATSAPAPKTSLTLTNPANRVKAHLESIGLSALFGKPGVFITGSRVWRPVYELEVAWGTDVDIMAVDHKTSTVDETRDDIVELLHLADSQYPTAPSMTDERELAIMPGKKYIHPNGLVVDIWGMENVYTALMQYPEHSHASSRMAWDCEKGCLLMYPNSRVALVTVPEENSYLLTDILDGL